MECLEENKFIIILEFADLLINTFKGYHNDIKGYHNDIKGYHYDIKGYHNDIKGYHNDIKGYHYDSLKLFTDKFKKVAETTEPFYWMDSLDIANLDGLLTKKTAARIVHNFLLKVCDEEDVTDWSEAKKLKDLYDCHTCVNHIAQVYAKGIMEADDNLVFGMDRKIRTKDAIRIAERTVSREKRYTKGSQEKEMVINYSELIKNIDKAEKVVVDVRSFEQYEQEHIKGSIHCSMNDILKNPYLLEPYKDIWIICYCDKGYQSDIAVNCLKDHGFRKVISMEKCGIGYKEG